MMPTLSLHQKSLAVPFPGRLFQRRKRCRQAQGAIAGYPVKGVRHRLRR